MSCIHSSWGGYCKLKQQFPEIPCSPHCKDYCTEKTSMKNTVNKGPATNTNCACNNSTAENDYVSMLEMFINKLYTDINHGFFGLTAFQAEKRTEEDMLYLGYNTEMVNRACVDTMNSFKSKNNAPLYRLKCFVNDMLSKPHKDYSNDDNDYITLLEKFINNMYPESNWRFFNLDIKTAENRIVEDMLHLGWNDYMIKDAFDKTVSSNQSAYVKNWARFDAFVTQLDRIPHKPYDNYCSTNFRFVLTLILGYLGKLNTVDIIQCHEPKIYFKSQIDHIPVSELRKALNKTIDYVNESKDIDLAKGMRMVEQWFEELPKENILPKELTIADIEKQLGYKIKIVGEDK